MRMLTPVSKRDQICGLRREASSSCGFAVCVTAVPLLQGGTEAVLRVGRAGEQLPGRRGGRQGGRRVRAGRERSLRGLSL